MVNLDVLDPNWMKRGRTKLYQNAILASPPEDVFKEEFYDWIDLMQKSGVSIGGNQPKGTKQIGKGIEMRLYSSLWDAVSDLLSKLTGKESKAEVLRGVREIVSKWESEGLPAVENAFGELFKRGFGAGITSTGLPTKMGTQDISAMKAIQEGRYRIGERIRAFADESIKEFQDVVTKAYTPEGVFDLDNMVKEMRSKVEGDRYKLERIARTETSNISNVGRLWAYNQDPDKYYYKYYWNSTPDKRRREMKKLRSGGNPYTFDEIKFLWLNNEQQVPGVGWQMGAINCRCSVSREPSDEELKGDRFEGNKHLFRKTMDFVF